MDRQTMAGIKLTKKQSKCIDRLEKALKDWDPDLHIIAITGTLYVMLKGDTEQNPIPVMSPSGGFNDNNIAECFTDIPCDGCDW